MKTGPRPKRSKGTWFVSFEPKERLRGSPRPLRAANTFRTEQETVRRSPERSWPIV